MSESEILSGESEAASAELLAPRHALPARAAPARSVAAGQSAGPGHVGLLLSSCAFQLFDD